MAAQTVDITILRALVSMHSMSAVGAEIVNNAGGDIAPTRTDMHGKPLSARALYIGVAGNVKVDLADGTTGVVFKNAPVGERPWAVTKVYQTPGGTAATDMLFLF